MKKVIYSILIIFTVGSSSIFSQESVWRNIILQNHSHDNVSSQLLQLSKYAMQNEGDARIRAKQAGMAIRPDGKVYIEAQYGWDPEVRGEINQLVNPKFEMQATVKNSTGGWIFLKDVLPFVEEVEDENFLFTCANNFSYDHEGTSATGADNWLNTVGGSWGNGVKIAIIDQAYSDLSLAVSAGTAPAVYTEHDFTSSGDPFESGGPHGTGQLEIVYAYATAAEYHLYKIHNTIQLGMAIGSCQAEGIDIIIHAASYFNTGWPDNSGGVCSLVKSATDDGIFWLNSAGNYDDTHAQAVFTDADGNNKHDWAPGINHNLSVVSNNTTVSIYLQWIGTPSFSNNFDLVLKDDSGTVLALSTSTSSYETITWTNNTGFDLDVQIEVNRLNSTNKKFEIFKVAGGEHDLNYSQTGGSTASPANSTEDFVLTTSVITFPGYDFGNGFSPSLWNHCSFGPTNGGNPAIDFCMPTLITLTSYPGGMEGTSTGPANLAGLMAMLMDQYPNFNNAELLDLIKTFALTAKDWGTSGQDEKYGFGGLGLPACVFQGAACTIPEYFIIEGTDNSANDPMGPFENLQQANSLAPANSVIYFLGGNYDPPPLGEGLINKKMIYKSYGSDAEIEE